MNLLWCFLYAFVVDRLSLSFPREVVRREREVLTVARMREEKKTYQRLVDRDIYSLRAIIILKSVSDSFCFSDVVSFFRLLLFPLLIRSSTCAAPTCHTQWNRGGL
eukprot:TRINITY_DN480_c0_g1_i2.p1 TRINITY_DN480_c0_g1~~TRINITY_DN480_c0_g1_i2.p1  ORF type:complete len:106 (+),score=1.69 TRINITY_DN480_c0_g1_i2:204-521(+)